jgi:lysylphosphatidylglycerol synthetase-like protein (DUF2156 family)
MDLVQPVLLNNNYSRFFGLALGTSLFGFCVEPVPDILKKAIAKSNILKFLVMIITVICAVVPKNNKELIAVAVCVIFVLILLEAFRQI